MRKPQAIVTEVVSRILKKTGYSLHRSDQPVFFESLIEAFLSRNKELFFIQIGANDGKSFDPIYEFVKNNSENVKGILIEPVADYFEELKLNYKNHPDVIILNQAVHNTKKKMTIHRVDPSRIGRHGLGKWAKGIASFNKEHHALSGTPEDAIVQEKVTCVSFTELIDTYQVEKLDLLQIDTEGYDAEIIRHIDFNAVKPQIIHFEHGLSDGIMSEEDFSTLAALLHDNGYEIWMEPYDATAYQRHVLMTPKNC